MRQINLKQCGIYQIKCLATNHIYIGSSINMKQRWCMHNSELSRGIHGNQKLQRSWDKHGNRDFKFSILLLCEPDEMVRYEQELIDLFQPFYNIAISVVNPMKGRNHTLESKLKMSVTKTGRGLSQEHRDSISKSLIGNTRHLGVKHSEETKEKMRQSSNHKWYQHSPEGIERIRQKAILDGYTRERDSKGRWL